MPDPSAILARGCLVVSCQAGPGNPFNAPEPMALLARAALAGGAVVVGTAITNPMETTARLVASIPRYSGPNSAERR
jgi:putative N-acetylmannosamine-6-phosphate epimerase